MKHLCMGRSLKLFNFAAAAIAVRRPGAWTGAHLAALHSVVRRAATSGSSLEASTAASSRIEIVRFFAVVAGCNE